MRRPAVRRLAAVAAALVPALIVLDLPGAALASPSASVAVRAVAGEQAVSLAWDPVALADHYVVEYARTSGPSSPTTVTTPETAKDLTGLVDRAGYRITVAAVAPDGSTIAQSAPVEATPTPDQPVRVTDVKARPAGTDSVLVTFSGGSRFRRIGVVAASSSSMTTDAFHTPWYPATTRSIVVPVPAKLRSELGGTTGNPVFLRVVQSNAATSAAPKSPRSSSPDHYKVSSTVWSISGPPAVDRTGTAPLRVAEFNVQSVTVSQAFGPALRWKARAPRVVKTVVATHPDLLLTAEMTVAKLDPTCIRSRAHHRTCPTQAEDLAKRLAAHGYRWATKDSVAKVKAAKDKRGSSYAVTVGEQILYKPSALTELAHGYLSSKYDLHVAWPKGTPDRWLAWTRFRVRANGREILAVAAHFKQGHDTATARLRQATAVKAVAAVQRIAQGAPVVFAGDFNADPVRDPLPPSRVLLGAGYTDAAATVHRANPRYPTVNGPVGHDNGYPSSVAPRTYAASRIDYIMLSGGLRSFQYANVVHLRAGSRVLKSSYRGSDHYLQAADIGVPDHA